MAEKVQWLGQMPWREKSEADLIKWTVQPPYTGMVKGDYYKAETNFQGRWGDKGHTGTLEVVVDDGGKIAFAEFNEVTMGNYYVRYFQNLSKRRTEYGFFQDFHDKLRSVAYHQVVANGFKHVEDQILAKQDLSADFDLLTGASFSASNLVGMTKVIDAEIKAGKKDKRYYGYAEKFGYGITGWLQVVVENGKIVRCFYDEIFADSTDEIVYDDCKQFYRLSKYHSRIFEEPFPTGWDREAWLVCFMDLSNALNDQVVKTQDLLNIDGLPCTEGPDLGVVWDAPGRTDGDLVSNVDACKEIERPRLPVWNNYLRLAQKVQDEMKKDGVIR